MKAIWITWQVHRRTREIARALDIPLIELAASRGPLKYPKLVAQTTRWLWRVRPTHLLVQCPSVVLAAWTALLKGVLGYSLIVDLHNEAVQPFINRSRWYAWLLRLIHRIADLSIVTNEALVSTVAAHGGRALVLPDRVPDMPRPSPAPTAPGESLVVFVCSFAPDEPYREVIEAGRALDGIARMAVTGRPVNVSAVLPANVTLTGFLASDDYDRLLAAATVVIDLTAMENCLVCGAYEAIGLGRPLVTSDTAALRAAFPKGVIFTRHTPAAIAAAIRAALEQAPRLSAEVIALRRSLDEQWNRRYQKLAEDLGTLSTATRPPVVVTRTGDDVAHTTP